MLGYATPEQQMLGSTHDVMDVEHDPIAQFEVIFPRSSHVTSTRTLPINSLVHDDHVPLKLEKLSGI